MPYADPTSPAAVASMLRRSRRAYAKHRKKRIASAAAWNRAHYDHVKQMAVIRRSQKKPPSYVLYHNAKQRARQLGLAFDLTQDDLPVPELCPVLGIPLEVATGHARDNSPSVDRINPSLGYVRGNVRVISHKANTIKSKVVPHFEL